MKMLTGLAAIAALASSAAYAHTHLTSSVPAQGSILAAAPAHIELKFSEATRLTALTLQKKEVAEQKLSPLPTSAVSEIKIPAPKLAAGKYTLQWRAVGDDDHVMTGAVQFTVDPNAVPSAGETPQKHEHAH